MAEAWGDRTQKSKSKEGLNNGGNKHEEHQMSANLKIPSTKYAIVSNKNIGY